MADGTVQTIPVRTAYGEMTVWSQRCGHNPRIKVLLLHGGPGLTHEYFEALAGDLVAAGIECYLYDQLGSAYSDQPDKPELWELSRFVDEVEQVRQHLRLERDNFYLLGHSWGGLLAIEYALKHQQHLKGLLISNMMASMPAFNAYAEQVLLPAAKQAVSAKNAASARHAELLFEHYNVCHMLRRPRDEWPDAVNRAFKHLNANVTVALLGTNDFTVEGKLATWDRTADLHRITVPALVIGAPHDTMDPAHMEKMASVLPNGRYLFCPQGSHFAMYDDQKVYIDGVIRFVRDVDMS